MFLTLKSYPQGLFFSVYSHYIYIALRENREWRLPERREETQTHFRKVCESLVNYRVLSRNSHSFGEFSSPRGP